MVNPIANHQNYFPVEKVFNIAGFSQEESEELMIHLYLNLA